MMSPDRLEPNLTQLASVDSHGEDPHVARSSRRLDYRLTDCYPALVQAEFVQAVGGALGEAPIVAEDQSGPMGIDQPRNLGNNRRPAGGARGLPKVLDQRDDFQIERFGIARVDDRDRARRSG